MKSDRKKRAPVDKDPKPYSFSDEVTEKKVRKHLEDINDVISEDDIKKVKIPGGESAAEIEKTAKKPVDPESSTEEKEKEIIPEEKQNITPWNILEG